MFSLFLLLGFQGKVVGQESQERRVTSTLDFEGQKLQILVYVFGEVIQQGWYRVPDNTNLVQVIPLVGETQYSQLGEVTITRYELADSAGAAHAAFGQAAQQMTIKYNTKKYLKNEAKSPPPLLKAGDIIYIRKNKWWTWSRVSAFVRDMALVASTYFIAREYSK